MAIFTLKQLIVYGFNKAEKLGGRKNPEPARDLFEYVDDLYSRNRHIKDDELDDLREEVRLSLFWENEDGTLREL